jgi:HK97 family phage prohead protease
MDIIRKSAEILIEYKDLESGIGGFEGYASTFGNVDLHKDVVVAGAFADSIKGAKKNKDGFPLLWQHDVGQPIGKINGLIEDEKGLLISGFFSATDKGQEARQLLKEGIINKMSIGFAVEKARYDDVKGLRYIEGVKLYEVSLVTFPANEKASITGVKSDTDLPKTKRDFEAHLRDIGFSRKVAKEITSCGFKHRDDDEEQDELEDEQIAVRDAPDELSEAIKALAHTIQRSTTDYGRLKN